MSIYKLLEMKCNDLNEIRNEIEKDISQLNAKKRALCLCLDIHIEHTFNSRKTHHENITKLLKIQSTITTINARTEAYHREIYLVEDIVVNLEDKPSNLPIFVHDTNYQDVEDILDKMFNLMHIITNDERTKLDEDIKIVSPKSTLNIIK